MKDGILVNLEDQDWLEAKDDLIEQIKSKQDFFRGAHLVLELAIMF